MLLSSGLILQFFISVVVFSMLSLDAGGQAESDTTSSALAVEYNVDLGSKHGINYKTQIPHETLQQIIAGANKGNRGELTPKID